MSKDYGNIGGIVMELSMLGAYLGMIMALTAFGCEVTNRLDSKSKIYLLMMGGGQILLGVRALFTKEWPFLALAIVWGTFAFWALLKRDIDLIGSGGD